MSMQSSGRLFLEGRSFTRAGLREYASSQAGSSGCPSWKVPVYAFIRDWLTGSGPIIQPSSGTTGRSKFIRLQRETMRVSAQATCTFFGLGPGDTALLCLPVNYIAGKMMIIRALTCGLDLRLAEPKSLPAIDPNQPVSLCAMVPLQVSRLLQQGHTFASMQNLIVGGAEISYTLQEQIRNLPLKVYATFGMAETASHIALRRLSDPGSQPDYHALPGIRLTQDERGCLVIEAPYLESRVVTNDLVTFTGTDSFVWNGRYDNLINSGGIKVVPEEKEKMIRQKAGLECAVLGLKDERLGNRLLVVLEKGSSPVADNLYAAIRDVFPARLRNFRIEWVDSLPRNSSMKIDRIRLKEIILGHGGIDPPLTPDAEWV